MVFGVFFCLFVFINHLHAFLSNGKTLTLFQMSLQPSQHGNVLTLNSLSFSEGWILGTVVLLKNSRSQNSRRELKCFKKLSFLLVVKSWTPGIRENFECSTVHLIQLKSQNYIGRHIQIWRMWDKSSGDFLKVLVETDGNSAGVQAILHSRFVSSPYLRPAVLSPKCSTGSACSLEINRNSQIRNSKHSLSYQSASFTKWILPDWIPPESCWIHGKDDFVRLGKSTGLHMLVQTKWADIWEKWIKGLSFPVWLWRILCSVQLVKKTIK